MNIRLGGIYYAKKTLMIHGGISADKNTGAVSIPVSHASTFKQERIGNFQYEYARTGNPTREALEALVRDIEGWRCRLCF